MARYILIDNYTGYIWGDTADFAAGHQDDITSITDAARMLDESNGCPDRTYREFTSDPRTTATGYHVYRADINGSEVFPTTWAGQDKAFIAAVERDCEYVGFVECVGV